MKNVPRCDTTRQQRADRHAKDGQRDPKLSSSLLPHPSSACAFLMHHAETQTGIDIALRRAVRRPLLKNVSERFIFCMASRRTTHTSPQRKAINTKETPSQHGERHGAECEPDGHRSHGECHAFREEGALTSPGVYDAGKALCFWTSSSLRLQKKACCLHTTGVVALRIRWCGHSSTLQRGTGGFDADVGCLDPRGRDRGSARNDLFSLCGV